ncbi:MAG: SDR family oxidoreductase [Candidatus Eremiobacteraeota bacterium]|nr:SDR family oxidoreductase [Candidatus Eremiobacteraeota bacterium]
MHSPRWCRGEPRRSRLPPLGTTPGKSAPRRWHFAAAWARPVPATADRQLALVTGASGGMGLEFAKLLAADGYDLALVARSEDKLRDVAASLAQKHGIEATPVALDLATPDAASALFLRVPRCDVLINNAGFASNGKFQEIPEARIGEELFLDVVTLTQLTRKYVPGMLERKNGKILNVASTAGFLPGPFMAVYYACKAYVISFSQAIAEELRGSGVTVSVFTPGATATGFAERAGTSNSLLFTKTPVANASAMARAGYRGMQRGQLVIVPPPLTNLVTELSARFTPRRVLLWFSRKAVERT